MNDDGMDISPGLPPAKKSETGLFGSTAP